MISLDMYQDMSDEVHVFVTEYGDVCIQTRHARVVMSRDEFMARLRAACEGASSLSSPSRSWGSSGARRLGLRG